MSYGHDRIVKWIQNGQLELTDNCWLWHGCLNSDGYPAISWNGNYNVKGHRAMFQIYYPDIDIQGQSIRHTCDNPLCMNPSHLLVGTSLENVADRVRRGRTFGHVTNEEIIKVHKLRELNMTHKNIADTLSCHHKRIEYILTNKLPSAAGG